MIIRLFRVSTHPGKEAEFEKFFRETALPLITSQPGLIKAIAGDPRPETPTEFCMVMVWRDLEALRAFAGDDWRSAHIHPDEAELVRARTVEHFDHVADAAT